jgi:hypothetical protein
VYVYLLYTLLGRNTHRTQNCQLTATLAEIGSVLVAASAGFIFYFRVIALWNFALVATSLVGLLYVILIAAWVSPFVQLFDV